MLLRMYTRWCDAHGYKYRMMDYQAGDEVGVKSCTLEIEGDYAYGYPHKQLWNRLASTT